MPFGWARARVFYWVGYMVVSGVVGPGSFVLLGVIRHSGLDPDLLATVGQQCVVVAPHINN